MLVHSKIGNYHGGNIGGGIATVDIQYFIQTSF
jgi:hypothetical protein